MNIFPSKYILSEIEFANDVIDFFLAEAYDRKKHGENVRLAQEHYATKSDFEQGYDTNFHLNLGYFSINEFLYYRVRLGKNNSDYDFDALLFIIDRLIEEKLISILPEWYVCRENRYKPKIKYAKFLYENNLVLNLLAGWPYIINKFSNSVIKIENSNNENTSIGTGFYFETKINNELIFIIITNKHVVENGTLKLYKKDDIEIPFEKIIIDQKRDLSFIILNDSLNESSFKFNESPDILSELITIGYPSIPMTKEAYQIYHRGELNSFVEDYYGNKLFLFSAKSSSGNSGSPIIDKYGMIIGIVTEELFEKDQFYTKGKLPYYAGIPSSEIIESLKEHQLYENLC